MRILTSIATMLLYGLALGQEQPQIGFIVLPFQNETSFDGKWPIGTDVPRFLSAYLKARYRMPSVSSLVVLNYLKEVHLNEESLRASSTKELLRDRFRVRYLVTGSLLAFDVSQFTVGTPNLGGYEAYKGEVRLRFELYDLVASPPRLLSSAEVAGEYADRSLALTLFGRPTDRTVEFRDLDKMAFGSEDFNRTVIGQACVQLSENLCKELESVLPGLKRMVPGAVNPDSLAHVVGQDTLSLQFRVIAGFIMLVEGDRLFVNLGSEDGVRKGMELFVYSQLQERMDAPELGTLEVLEVRGPHLSLARIRTGQGVIKERDRVRVRVLER